MSDIVGEGARQDTPNNPDAVKSAAGALNLYRGVIEKQAQVTQSFVVESGVLTDELRPSILSNGTFSNVGTVQDQRFISQNNIIFDRLFNTLQATRANARVAQTVLQKYGGTMSSALVGHMYAVEGMANVMLADLFCSGIPLSVVDVNGDYILQPGTSTRGVYEAAIALFDSALVLTDDSIRIQSFARVGKGRALIALERYAEAASAVNSVPNTFSYRVEYQKREGSSTANGFNRQSATSSYGRFTVSDSEGKTGLPYVSSGDPRTDTVRIPSPSSSSAYLNYVVKKYSDIDGNTPIIIASATEARLIEAESALHAGEPQWIDILNSLRTTCISSNACAVPAPAGIGGMTGLSPLEDPALDPIPVGKTVFDVRLDLIMKERAYWLFLTGHRQGDFRRLIRNYDRSEHTVYPTGDYYTITVLGQSYGSDVTFPVPSTERERNPLYQGCIDREA